MSTTEHDAIDLLTRANPVPPDALDVDEARRRAVLGALLDGPPPQAPLAVRRPLRVALRPAALAALVLAATVFVIGVLTGSESNALAIQRTDGYITLTIEDPGASAERMNRELRERGIDVEVELVPVLPAELGHWVGGRAVWPGVAEGADQHELGDERFRELNEEAGIHEVLDDPEDPRTMRIPARFKGHLLLYAGREARPGEKPWIDGNPPGAR